MHWTDKPIICFNCGAGYTASVIGQTSRRRVDVQVDGELYEWEYIDPEVIYSLCPNCFPKEGN